jgi:hypothetical protein
MLCCRFTPSDSMFVRVLAAAADVERKLDNAGATSVDAASQTDCASTRIVAAMKATLCEKRAEWDEKLAAARCLYEAGFTATDVIEYVDDAMEAAR